MKYCVAFICSLLFLTGVAFAQNGVTYDIHPGNEYKVPALADALDMCDLTKYRKENERVKMLFDDDAIVELYSANELMANGIEVNTDYINHSQQMLLNLFRLHPDGWLIEDASKLSKEESLIRLEKLRRK